MNSSFYSQNRSNSNTVNFSVNVKFPPNPEPYVFMGKEAVRIQDTVQYFILGTHLTLSS